MDLCCAAVALSISPACVRHWKGTEQMGIRLKRWDAPNYLMSKGIGLICRFSTLVRLSGGNRLRNHFNSISILCFNVCRSESQRWMKKDRDTHCAHVWNNLHLFFILFCYHLFSDFAHPKNDDAPTWSHRKHHFIIWHFFMLQYTDVDYNFENNNNNHDFFILL